MLKSRSPFLKRSPGEWLEIGDKRYYFRSKWERNYARFLQYAKSNQVIFDWQYEPKEFWFENIKRGVRSFKPDFLVIYHSKGLHSWYEVKGYMDSKSATKIKRMKKYYPEEFLTIVDKKWFQMFEKEYASQLSGWEYIFRKEKEN